MMSLIDPFCLFQNPPLRSWFIGFLMFIYFDVGKDFFFFFQCLNLFPLKTELAQTSVMQGQGLLLCICYISGTLSASHEVAY